MLQGSWRPTSKEPKSGDAVERATRAEEKRGFFGIGLTESFIFFHMVRPESLNLKKRRKKKEKKHQNGRV